MHPLRVRFAGDIIADVMPPRRRSHKVVLLCDGLPTVPCKGAALDFLSRKKYWAVHIRYRGTWESGGKFLRRSPHQDALDVAAALSKGFMDSWDGKRYRVEPERLYVIGSSFGGTAAIMASPHARVTKAVALAPVIDWTKEGKGGTERPEYLREVIRSGYAGAYRFAPGGWRKLLAGGFFDPWPERATIDGDKLLVIHAQDDEVTSHALSAKFSEATGCAFISRKRGGHLSLSAAMRPANWRRIERFFGDGAR